MEWLKKGDRVKMLCDAGNLKKGETYVINIVDENDPDCPYYVNNELWVCADQLMPVYEFHVGQRVRIRSWESMKREFGEEGGRIISNPHFVPAMESLCGRTAIISSLDGNDVDLKDWSDKSGDTIWNYSTDMLEPVEEEKPKFEVGQIYRVGNVDSREGNIIKVTDVDDDWFEYATIRGKDTMDSAHEDSSFADALKLLTGKEIGEAIRKWDADHAKEPESEYNEVKRHAKVGEYVKVLSTDSRDTGRFKVGDILKVTQEAGSYWKGKGVCFNGTINVIEDKQYVVLEGYKLEQKEERRKAKVGDTIKILRDNGGKVRPGTVWAVKEVRSDGSLGIIHADDDLTWACHGDNYVVIPSGKHSYTAEQIAEAKKLCGEMMMEAFDDNKTFAFHFYDKQNGGYIGDCEKNEVKADFKSFDATEDVGIAKCSDHDEYNIWIGRCAALCKVLHKPIPAFIMGDGKGKHFDFERAKSKGYNEQKKYTSIHCTGEQETRALMKELEAIECKWNSGHRPTECYYGDGYFNILDSKLIFHNCCYDAEESKYVEFSDCFTED